MKKINLSVVTAMSLVLISSFGFAKDAERKPTQKAYTYSFEKKMTLENCLREMSVFAKDKQAKLEMWQSADFYILDKSGERIGNAYYSSNTCYIYLD